MHKYTAGLSGEMDEESAPLLTNMVSEKVGNSQQILVSQCSLSSSRKCTQYLAALIVTVGGFIAGSCLAWTSPVAPILTSGQDGFLVNNDEMAWIGSFMPLGALLGSILSGYLVDRIGRKNLILVMSIPCVIGWANLAFSHSVILFCLGRFLTGVGAGCYCIAVSMYISEIAEKQIRGTLGTYFQLQITIGILAVYTIGSLASITFLTVFCGAVPLIYAVLMFFVPETPYFLMMKRDIPAAQKSLAWFRGAAYDGRTELECIQKSIEDDASDAVHLSSAFRTTAAKRGLIIGLGVMFFQQFSGCNAVIFYTTSIFTDAGATIDPKLSTIVVGVAQTVSTWVASLIVDKLGRKVLLLLSIVVMTLSTFTLGLYFYLKDNVKENVSDIGWLPLLSLSSYIIIFSLGFGPIPWMLVAEIFPSKIKGAASSMACFVNWTCVFLITNLFPMFVTKFGAGITFWCFTTCTAIGTAFVLFVVPETKGKTLAEIQEMLGGEISQQLPHPTNQFAVSGRGIPFEQSKVQV